MQKGAQMGPFLLEIFGETIGAQYEGQNVKDGVSNEIKNKKSNQQTPTPFFEHAFDAFFFSYGIGIMNPLGD